MAIAVIHCSTEILLAFLRDGTDSHSVRQDKPRKVSSELPRSYEILRQGLLSPVLIQAHIFTSLVIITQKRQRRALCKELAYEVESLHQFGKILPT
ncbi:hypothetical protein FCM35_KLT01067 [Carex littledalei]|uniref:Uncharacterized protein n=1 Tax=Carex littledalei TaxID=544730 RepID=A0A833R570_9POAL|nr:hypothetical protein FCM35_KLT01067 [Carex littledalei]